ncbi:hypothetical protein GN958_ATG18881 [Phytophthora infestans]|uniref:Uncharacterized protein n=1 Tax=Phytophthora infestans TaxID=4787 RepID=A0A8S9U108_PHYIN|nr:hypothetical protein GN958_ATG18881 [Phytophthora infestans]
MEAQRRPRRRHDIAKVSLVEETGTLRHSARLRGEYNERRENPRQVQENRHAIHAEGLMKIKKWSGACKQLAKVMDGAAPAGSRLQRTAMYNNCHRRQDGVRGDHDAVSLVDRQ